MMKNDKQAISLQDSHPKCVLTCSENNALNRLTAQPRTTSHLGSPCIKFARIIFL